jgi:hypothetical protein
LQKSAFYGFGDTPRPVCCIDTPTPSGVSETRSARGNSTGCEIWVKVSLGRPSVPIFHHPIGFSLKMPCFLLTFQQVPVKLKDGVKRGKHDSTIQPSRDGEYLDGTEKI